MVRSGWQISVKEDLGVLHLQIYGLFSPDHTISALSELLAAAQAHNIDKFLIDKRKLSSLRRLRSNAGLYLQFHRLCASHARKTAILFANHQHDGDDLQESGKLPVENGPDLRFFFEAEQAFQWLAT
jgi:hypothetical protein